MGSVTSQILDKIHGIAWLLNIVGQAWASARAENGAAACTWSSSECDWAFHNLRSQKYGKLYTCMHNTENINQAFS